MRFRPQMLAPLLVIALVAGGGFYVEAQRARQRSTLSGFFESQPTQVASLVPASGRRSCTSGEIPRHWYSHC